MNNNKTRLVSIRTRQNVQLINPDEIVCCILKNKKANVVLVSGECIETLHNLRDLERKLRHCRFIRCHAGCLINLDKRLIFDSKNCKLELLNKQKITVSKNRKATINRLLKEND